MGVGVLEGAEDSEGDWRSLQEAGGFSMGHCGTMECTTGSGWHCGTMLEAKGARGSQQKKQE